MPPSLGFGCQKPACSVPQHNHNPGDATGVGGSLLSTYESSSMWKFIHHVDCPTDNHNPFLHIIIRNLTILNHLIIPYNPYHLHPSSLPLHFYMFQPKKGKKHPPLFFCGFFFRLENNFRCFCSSPFYKVAPYFPQKNLRRSRPLTR